MLGDDALLHRQLEQPLGVVGVAGLENLELILHVLARLALEEAEVDERHTSVGHEQRVARVRVSV